MAKYYVTGIIKETKGNHTFISKVTLHLVDDKVHRAELKSKNEVIALIKAKHEVYSATWNYNNISWTMGERVTTEVINGEEYLKTRPDDQLRDNLLHLLPLANLGL